MRIMRCSKRFTNFWNRRKAQVASMDIIMATVMFLMVAAFILSYIFSGVTDDKLSALDGESRIILSALVSSDSESSSELHISDAGNLNQRALESFINKMLYTEGFYDDMKSEFNIENEFCIHIEDADGNLVYLSELIDDKEIINLLIDESNMVYGLGSSVIHLGGNPCFSN